MAVWTDHTPTDNLNRIDARVQILAYLAQRRIAFVFSELARWHNYVIAGLD